jgi:hypothetical protein
MVFAPVASGDLIQAETINNIVSGAVWFSTGSGSANNYSVTFDGVTGNNKNKITGPLTAGLLISFTAPATNTGASTLAVLGPSGPVATPPIKKSDGAELGAGDIVANQVVTVVYNAAQTRFELISSQGGLGSITLADLPSLPRVSCFKSADQSIPANVWTPLVWQSGQQFGGLITLPSSTATVVQAGLYLISAAVQWAWTGDTPPQRFAAFFTDGPAVMDLTPLVESTSATNLICSLHRVLPMTVGQDISVQVYHSCTSNQTVMLNSSSFQVTYLGNA